MGSNSKYHFAIIGANIFFGLNYGMSKIVIPDSLTPEALGLLRLIFATVMFLTTLLFIKKVKIEKKDYIKLLIGGLLGTSVNQLIFLKGLNFTSPVDAAIICTINPLLVFIISTMFMYEKLSFVRLAGIFIGGSGALITILQQGQVNFSGEQIFGNIMVLGSSVCYALYLVTIKPVIQKYGSFNVLAIIFTIGTFSAAPFIWKDLAATNWNTIDSKSWGALIFVLVCATYLSYMLIGYGLKGVKSTTVAIYSYSQPVIASFFAVIIGSDKITASKIISAILVFIGVALVTQSLNFNKNKILEKARRGIRLK